MSRRADKNASQNATKADLVEAVYRRHGGLTKLEAGKAVDALLDTMKSNLGGGRTIKIKNFGVFRVVSQLERRGVDPITGEKIQIPKHKGLRFRPASRLIGVVESSPKEKSLSRGEGESVRQSSARANEKKE